MTEDSSPIRTDIPWDLFTNYATGSSTEGERVEAERWIASHPEHEALLQSFFASWKRGVAPARKPLNLAAVEEEIFLRIRSEAGKSSVANNYLGYILTAVSVVLLVIGSSTELRQSIFSWATHNPSISGKVYSTKVAQRASVTLGDGTTAILAPATTLRVSGRNVYVDGHALFTVASNSASPFVINTGNTQVRVLGTAFSVRKYSEEQFAQVIVAEGKVAVNDAVVTTGEIALAIGSNTPKVSRENNVSTMLAWAQGRLVFQNAPAQKVFAELSRWYGIDIKADAGILADNITVELASESASEAVDFIATFLNAKVERRGSTVFLRRY